MVLLNFVLINQNQYINYKQCASFVSLLASI